MKSIRLLHLYLGCAFAPLLMFFIFTGLLQTFELHEGKKSGTYRPPAWLAAAGSVHTHQRLPSPDREKAASRTPLRIVFSVMCAGLLATTTLGLVMAWSMQKNRRGVIAALAAGTAIPLVILLLQ